MGTPPCRACPAVPQAREEERAAPPGEEEAAPPGEGDGENRERERGVREEEKNNLMCGSTSW